MSKLLICKKKLVMKDDVKLSVDSVVFGYDQNQGLRVLLIKRGSEPFKSQWALPGGFVYKNERLDSAAKRELEEETGVKVNFLEQLYTFGDPGRDPRMRVISVAYFGLVRSADFQLNAKTDAEDAAWFNIKKLPGLAFDHQEIIEAAVQRLRGKLTYEPIGFELIDKEFPFSDLEKLYQTLLNRDLDRRNFKRKILAYGFLEELPKSIQRKAGRPAKLFRFNQKKYFDLKKRGYNFDLFY
jgi:8-oxo-dGTP diphosphatase